VTGSGTAKLSRRGQSVDRNHLPPGLLPGAWRPKKEAPRCA
jgi:hypothetical protein